MTTRESSPVFPGLDAASGQPEPAAGAADRVIVGIDGSAESRAALRWALRYARRTGSRVEAVAAWQFPPPLLGATDVMLTADDIQAAARRWLDEAAAGAGVHPDGGLQLLAVHGDPFDVLLERAGNAALIVLGNKGRGSIAAAVLGSVAQRCVQHARCPVVLVPATYAQM
jgi:nucleotide-binding universal stress UspA family protein